MVLDLRKGVGEELDLCELFIQSAGGQSFVDLAESLG
jgi:hypothetical protein